MVKHSASCGAGSHDWTPGLVANYRQCGQCHSVEMFVDGQWISPAGRKKQASVVAPARTLMEDAGVVDRDLQATVKPLSEVPVSATDVYRAARRAAGEILFKRGTEHEYPDFSFSVSDRTYTVAGGASPWRSISFNCALEVVEAALASTEHYQIERISMQALIQRRSTK